MPPKIHIFVKSASSYFLASVFFSFHPLFMLSPSSPFPSLPFSSVDGLGEYGTLPVLQQLAVAWLLSCVRALVLSALGAVNTATSRRRWAMSDADDVYTLWLKTPRPYYFSNNSVHSILNKLDTSDYALAHHT